MLGTSTSSSQLGAPFHLHFCLSPPPLYFLSLVFIHTLLLTLLAISARGILYIGRVTLFAFDAFQLFSLSIWLFFFSLSLPFFPIAFNLTPILSFSLYDSLFFAGTAILSSHCDFTAETQKRRTADRTRHSGRKGIRD